VLTRSKLNLLILLGALAVCDVVLTACAFARPLPDESGLFYRRYRGVDEVGDRNGRGGSSGHDGSGGGTSSGGSSGSGQSDGSGHDGSSGSGKGGGGQGGSNSGSTGGSDQNRDPNDRFGK
jgi:hypothetical protein